MTIKNVNTYLISATLLIGASSAPGTTLLEQWDYSAGAIDGVSQNGGTGFLGAWTTQFTGSTIAEVEAVNLISAPSGYSALTSGGQLLIANDNAAGTNNMRRSLSSTFDFDGGETTYFSMLFRRDDTGNTGGSEFVNFARLESGSTAIANLGGSSTELLTIATPGVGSTYTSSATYDIGTDYLIVGKLESNFSGTIDRLAFTFFEEGETIVEPLTWDAETTRDLSAVIDSIAFTTGKNSGTVRIDEIRFGDSFSGVTAASIPEPSTYALGVGVIMLGIVCIKRKRS